MEIITRQQALTLGLNKYFTGKPCKNGHVAERYIQSSTCELCIRGSLSLTPNPKHNQQRTELQQQRTELERIKSEQRQQRIDLAKERFKLVRLKADQKATQMEIDRKKLELRQSRIEAKRPDLIEIHVVLKQENHDYFFSVMMALASLVDITLTANSLKSPKALKMLGNHVRYIFRVPPSIVEDLRVIESSLNGPQSPATVILPPASAESPREIELNAALKNIDFAQPGWEHTMSTISEELSDIRQQLLTVN
jgi:hypothetical protein